MECRPGCGACCTAPSISSPIPGMPDGKPANTPCIQLDEQQRALRSAYPDVWQNIRQSTWSGFPARRRSPSSHRPVSREDAVR
ncbi:TPA: hypothetical protein ACUK77_002281 [Escherichia coli]|uniref:hypothetical protein n=1 Tax=Escherichia coli TaxID=562 RepID=UPI003D7FA0B6